MIRNNYSFLPTKIDITSRDVTCFVFAAIVHSLLFLWKGGVLQLPQDQGSGLGDMIVGVNFLADVPDYNEQAGGGAPKAQGLLSRIASMVKGQGAPKRNDASGVDESQSNWAKAEKLTDKPFSTRDGFQGLKEKVDSLDIAKGTSKEVVMKPSQGNFEKAQPNLKENNFKMAKMDVPFPILKPKTQDALANVNAIPVVVGKTTSGSVKSLDGGPGAGPALQSKTFASKGSTAGTSFSGMGKSSGGDTSGSGGLQLASGGSGAGSGAISGIGSGASGSGSGAGGGVGGSGYGDGGSGGGRGGGSGSGFGSGSGGGRAWGGGSGGFGSGGMQTLPRRSVPSDAPSTGSSVSKSHPGFTITGALANRPIAQKVLPPYTSDARVALRFRVDWSGKVLDGIIVEISSGSPSFDRQVIASLKQWLFSPLSTNRTNEVQEGLVSFVFKGV